MEGSPSAMTLGQSRRRPWASVGRERASWLWGTALPASSCSPPSLRQPQLTTHLPLALLYPIHPPTPCLRTSHRLGQWLGSKGLLSRLASPHPNLPPPPPPTLLPTDEPPLTLGQWLDSKGLVSWAPRGGLKIGPSGGGGGGGAGSSGQPGRQLVVGHGDG